MENCKIWIRNAQECKDVLKILEKYLSVPKHARDCIDGYLRIDRDSVYPGTRTSPDYSTDFSLQRLADGFSEGPWYTAQEFISKYRKENMTTKDKLREAYILMQKNCGIEAGDTVKVLRKAQDEENGWGTFWHSPMTKMIGRTSKVKSVEHMHGYGCFIDDWYFPFFILELVEKSKAKIMIDDLEVTFNHDRKELKIGCKIVSYDKVREIFNQIKDQK